MAAPGAGARTGSVYDALARHNRLIARLRIITPLIGVVVLVALVAQIWIANMGVAFNAGGLSFDRGILTIDAPRFSGTTPDGMVYDLTASTARTRLGDTAHSELSNLRLSLRGNDGYSLQAVADSAELSLATQIVQVKGPMKFTDTTGTTGQLLDPVIDWPNQTLSSSNPVHMKFGSGATIDAAGVRYDGHAGRWVFGKAALVLPGNQGTTP